MEPPLPGCVRFLSSTSDKAHRILKKYKQKVFWGLPPGLRDMFAPADAQQSLLQAVKLRSEQLSMDLIESYESLVRSRQ